MKRIISCALSLCVLFSIAAFPVEAVSDEITSSSQAYSEMGETELLAEDIPVTFSPATAFAANGTEYAMLGDSMGLIGLKWYGAKVADVRLNNGYNTGLSNNAAVWINSVCQTLYCMEPAAPTSGGTQYNSTWDVFSDSPYVCKNVTAAKEKEQLIGVILQYGCMQVNNPVTDEQALHYLATQVLIHEVILEERNANFDYIGVSAGCTPVRNSYQFTHWTYENRFNEIYNDMVHNVQTYYTRPSFTAATEPYAPIITLDKYDYNSGEYYTDIHSDTGAVSEFFPVGQYGDYTLTPWGNDDWLRVAAKVNNPNEQTITDNRNDPIPGLVFWGASGKQAMGQSSGEVPDPVNAYFKVKVGYFEGTLSISKTAEAFYPDSNSYAMEDGAGHTFELLKDGQVVERNTTTTNCTQGQHLAAGGQLNGSGTIISGDIQMDVSPITGDSFTVTVKGLPSNSYNILLPIWTEQNGQDDLVWYPIQRDENNACCVTVPLNQHKNETGAYNIHLYFNQMGSLTFDHLAPGDYAVREVNTPEEYVQPENQTVCVAPVTDANNASQITQMDFNNVLKKGTVGYIKKCSYYQNMRLRGAVYGVYDNNDVLIQTLTSDAEYVYSSPLPYGNYYLKEIAPPEYYAKDDHTYSFSITEDGQRMQITAWNAPMSDVYPEFIQPNSDYRQGTQIIASYMIHNDSIAEHTPDKPLTVRLIPTITKEDGTTEQLPEQIQTAIDPKFSENLVFFSINIPEDAAELSLTCSVDTPEGVIESNEENNQVEDDFQIAKKPCADTPDTVFENTPEDFSMPDENAEIPTGDITDAVTDEASWQQWSYENGAFVLNTYGAQLTSRGIVTPDAGNPSAETTADGYLMKSGYGIGVTQQSSIGAVNGLQIPAADAYILPQNGNVYYPEYAYQLETGCYSTLEQTQTDRLELQGSPYTFQSDGTQDYRRTHFTPLWFPDGAYTVKTYVYDCRTPAGMLSVPTTLEQVQIQNNAYDDRYLSHRKQEE